MSDQTTARRVEVSVDRPKDRATRDGAVVYAFHKNETVQAGSLGGRNTNNHALYTNSTDSDQYIEQIHLRIRDNPHPGIMMDWDLVDAGSTAQFETFAHPTAYPVSFDPVLQLLPDWQLFFAVTNPTPIPVDVDAAALIRDEVDAGP